MEDISNYYESVVIAQLDTISANLAEFSDDDLADVVCIALNRLPCRYYRHGIDLRFYTSVEEQAKSDEQVQVAIDAAIDLVRSSPRH